ncbi:MAG: AAA family ATPase [Planctomycetaceae bacterium]
MRANGVEQREVAFQWSVLPSGGFQICGRTLPRLPEGAYDCEADMDGQMRFNPRNLKVDELIDCSASLAARLLQEIEQFWTLGERFHKHGFLHRRGYLLHGRQGSGKSSVVHQVICRTVAAGGVAFFCEHPTSFVACMQQFRSVEPQRPMLCIFEDIDSMTHGYGVTALLQWLDGNHQVDRVVNIATTNYPEKLERRLIARPRRFDRVLCINCPDRELRDAYFARKLPHLPVKERRRWVELSEDLSFASMSELIISVCCLEKDLTETAALLKDLDQRQPSSSDYEDAAESERRGRSGGHDSYSDRVPF